MNRYQGKLLALFFLAFAVTGQAASVNYTGNWQYDNGWRRVEDFKKNITVESDLGRGIYKTQNLIGPNVDYDESKRHPNDSRIPKIPTPTDDYSKPGVADLFWIGQFRYEGMWRQAIGINDDTYYK